ncbi:DgyrCDS13997 [Dimorphilus gyrociliatus]|uniref:DgyrCDS13997 n=1 Tax=Dimorphilus gyrociliatus TaxID=2664684 RepID=A0A7I8WC84_9ANNE|nr:DgyrCDS13997 [Dimorphilus gyrociliatus]
MAETTPTFEDLVKQAKDLFKTSFDEEATHGGSAPGRVNLIGEHTDYNDGFVLPMALPLRTVIVGKPSKNCQCTIVTSAVSIDGPLRTTFHLPSDEFILEPGSPKWANYVKGVVAHFDGQLLPFNAAIVSSVPLGGGLSSSASLEVATYCFLKSLIGETNLDRPKVAEICQKAEHTFPNMPCGVMDQTISVLGEEGYALLLDCRSLETFKVPLIDPNTAVLIINSNVRHILTGSEYPERRQQCYSAADKLDVKSLRDATIMELESKKEKMSELEYNRAHHVITENDRCLKAKMCLEKGDLISFGKLMYQSHESLRDKFQVSCSEIDQLVDIVSTIKGVYGTRMTGGGFGGCTVTLCESKVVSDIIKKVKSEFDANERKATFYVVSPSYGAEVLNF